MASVVTGLSQAGDLAALRTALQQAGLSLEPLQAIGPDDSTRGVARGIVGPDLITSDLGTGVPGLNSRHSMTQFFRNESLDDRLGDLEIPDSEIDNYVEALERGRTVVAYFARPENLDAVLGAFRASDLTNVRTFS